MHTKNGHNGHGIYYITYFLNGHWSEMMTLNHQRFKIKLFKTTFLNPNATTLPQKSKKF